MKMKRMQILAIVLSVLMMSIFSVNLASGEFVGCIDLEKTGPETAAPGDTITYHFWVKNCGNVKLWAGYAVYDPLFGSVPIWSSTLEPGAVHEFNKTYTLPGDYCGEFINAAWAIGHPLTPDGYLPDVRDDDSWTVDVICEPPLCQTDLIAGQNWDSPAGVVTVEDNGEHLYVTFETTSSWSLDDTHLYVGTVVPTKAAPGKFPYKARAEYIIPLSDFGVNCGDTLYIAAHAVVSKEGQQETAWADSYGISFGKGWAMYFKYEVCGGCVEP